MSSKIRNYQGQYYNYTSEAYDYDIYNKPIIRKKILKRKKVRYILAEKNVKWLSLKFIIALLTITSFCVTSIGIQSRIIQKRIQLSDLNSQLKTIYENNDYIRTELSKNLNLNELRELALSIGMQNPTEDQIVYINVPKESYTVKNDDLGIK